jgi:hypothetical protein
MGVTGGDPARLPFQRAPLWRGINEITLACDVGASGISANFCNVALEEARRGAPYPIRLADGSGGLNTLALHLAVATDVDTRTLTIAGERAVTIDEAEGSLLPRITCSIAGEAVERTLARAFDAALPWRRQRAGTIRAVRD